MKFMKGAASVMKKVAIKKKPAAKKKPVSAMKAGDRMKAISLTKAMTKAIAEGKLAGEDDVSLLREPYCSFIRELYNSRGQLRPLMHPS